MFSVAKSSKTHSTPAKADPFRMVRIPGWRPVEVVLIAMLGSGLALAPWMRAAHTPSIYGDAKITPGMSKADVLVKLGEPNERHANDVCWNYDRFDESGDRICIRFGPDGHVQEVEN